MHLTLEVTFFFESLLKSRPNSRDGMPIQTAWNEEEERVVELVKELFFSIKSTFFSGVYFI